MQTQNNELQHHGVKGMKWGVRRTKAQLGYAVAKYKKKRLQKKDEKTKAEEAKPKRKSISEMSDDELNYAIDRARREDTYRALRPEPVSKGKRFADTLVNKVVGPAATEAGERFLKNALNKFGDNLLKDANVKSEYDKLKDEYNLLKVKTDISDLKNSKKKSDKPEVKTWDDMLKKQQYEDNENDKKDKTKDKEDKGTDSKDKEDKGTDSKDKKDKGTDSKDKKDKGENKGTDSKDKKDERSSWSSSQHAAEAFRRAARENGYSEEEANRMADEAARRWDEYMSRNANRSTSSTNSQTTQTGREYVNELLDIRSR